MPDEYSAVKALVFERLNYDAETGKFRNTGEMATFPARTVCVAAGTSPNVIYEKEKPGTFKLDEWRQFFQPFKLEKNGDGKFHAVEAEKGEDRIFHFLRTRRKIHFLLRRQSSEICRQRRQSDGLGEVRLSKGRRAFCR